MIDNPSNTVSHPNSIFIDTKSLRRLLRIFWQNTISNEELIQRCHQNHMQNILQKSDRWLRHVLRREQSNLSKKKSLTVQWTQLGKERKPKKHLAKNCGRTPEDIDSYKAFHPRIGSGQKEVGILCCCLSCHTGTTTNM